MEAEVLPVQTRTVITETWFSHKPSPVGFLVSAFFTLSLAVASLIYWSDSFGAAHWMAATPSAVFENHQVWQVFTSIWAHADQKHLLSNSFFFFILGGFLNAYFGPLIFPLLAIAFGGLTNLIVLKTMPMDAHLLGASGVVFWMGGAWLTLYALMDVARTYRQRFLRSLGVGLLLFFPTEAFDPNVSYLSHLWGFIFGVVAGLGFYWLRRKTFQQAIVTKTVIDD